MKTPKVLEYEVQFHWLPDLSGLPEGERVENYRKLLSSVTKGWLPTEESLARAHLPAEHLSGTPEGWITRIEVYRKFQI